MGPRRTRVLRIGTGDAGADKAAIREAAEVLRGGGLVAFPTETVYGLGADATNPDAVRAIFEAKGRPATNPVIVHACDRAMARACVAEWPEAAERLAARLWPGPLTLVLRKHESIPDVVTAGGETVGVRVPAHWIARRLIAEAGRLIAAPSANRSTAVSPTRAGHVLKDLEGRIDLILDAGACRRGIESTVVELGRGGVRILRPGPLRADEIERVLGEAVAAVDVDAGSAVARSPGRLPLHYAPRTPLILMEAVPWPPAVKLPPKLERYALIVFDHMWHRVIWHFWDAGVGEATPARPRISARLDVPSRAEKVLYWLLHKIDAEKPPLEATYVVMPPDTPEWSTIRDRLTRAAGRG
jgi:L-threonylcarbamoyladenylate synthase